MATTTTITTSYAGTYASRFISAALLSSSTLSKNLIEILPNVNYKTTLQTVNLDDILKDATCDFTPSSSLTLTDRVLEVEPFQVNLQVCKKDFYASWIGGQMGSSAYDGLPATFAEYLIAYTAGKTAQRIETNIWNGAAAISGQFDGLVPLMTADAAVTKVAAVGGGVNAANVIAQMGRVVDVMPAAVFGREDLIFYVSQNVAKSYIRTLGGFSATGSNGYEARGTMWSSRDQSLSFDGIRVEMVNGLTANQMVLAEKSNLFFGTGLENDKNEVKVLDMSDLDGSDNIRVIMRLFAGVNYGIGADTILYS